MTNLKKIIIIIIIAGDYIETTAIIIIVILILIIIYEKIEFLICCHSLSCLCLFTWLKFMCVNVSSQKRVSGINL